MASNKNILIFNNISYFDKLIKKSHKYLHLTFYAIQKWYLKRNYLPKFIIYDDSKLIQSPLFKVATSFDFIGEIKNSEINTGIMISVMKINDLSIYLFILDNRIFIIKRINLPQFREYFNEHLDFFKLISSEDQNSIEQKDINTITINEIIRIIIKKAQYRTLKMRHELLPDTYNSKNEGYKLGDFI